jgi:GNAT superfamily N-acetyltransferase
MDMAPRRIELRRPRVENAEFLALVEASRIEGYWMLTRLLEGWRDGTGRFSRHGEALLAAYCDGKLAGVCGLGIDPYVEQRREGRVRHLYVTEAHRRQGVGRLLVKALIDEARLHFPVLNVRATENAFEFYEKLGFHRVEGEEFMTHRKMFRTRRTAGRPRKAKAE